MDSLWYLDIHKNIYYEAPNIWFDNTLYQLIFTPRYVYFNHCMDAKDGVW
jgi:hypothetical protein